MIVKEARAERWPVLVGLGVIALRVLSVLTVNLGGQSLASLQYQFDADFSAVAARHVSAAAAFLWATFFNDLTLYLLVGFGGALLGAGLVASESSSGSIFVLLSRPVSRVRALLTKYGVAAALSLGLCVLSGCLALAIGAWQGIAGPPAGGFAASVLLLWLAMLFVVGLTLLYSVALPSSLAAGALGFFTTYVLGVVPFAHTGTGAHAAYFVGGPDWSVVSYWGSLGIYAGTASPVKSLIVAAIAAAIPAAAAAVLFVRKAF